MNYRHPIDRIFQKSLENYDSGAGDHIWDNINKYRKQRKKRVIGKVLFYSSLAASLALVVVILQSLEEKTIAPPPAGFYLSGSTASNQPATKEISIVQNVPSSTGGQSRRNVVAPSFASMPSSIEPEELPLRKTMATSLYSGDTDIDISNTPPLPPLQSITAIYDDKRRSSMPKSPECSKFEAPGLRWTLDFLAAPQITFKTLKATDPVDSEYAEIRQQTEKNSSSYTAAVRLGLTTAKGWSLRSGVQFTQINEKFGYSTAQEEKITIINKYDNQGNITGTDTLREKTLQRTVSTNQYKRLDIPLLAGFEWRKGKTGFVVNTGPIFNVSFSTEGKMLTPGLEIVSLSNGEKSHSNHTFKKTLDVGWYAGVAVSLPISPKTQLMVEPHLQFHPASVTQPSHHIKQAYSQAGLSIGLRHSL